jgi:glycosyltransferase involved in cell wall biosynthesis
VSAAELRFAIESALPAALAAGRGNALLVHGWCFHPEQRVRGLELGLGASSRPAIAHSMPRPDLAVATAESPNRLRSGFWGLVETGRTRFPRRLELTLTARLAGGAQASAAVAEIEVVPSIPTDWDAVAHPPKGMPPVPLVTVCMPTYEPRLDLLAAQIESLRAQQHPTWHCVIADDASGPGVADEIGRLIAGDERFVLRRHQQRLGVYRNVERALGYVPPGVDAVALCDQDDRWHPGKLAALVASLTEEVSLSYCEMRVVDGDGGELSPSYWQAVRRRNEHRDMATLMVANTVTGAASVFRRSLLSALLPFPEAPGPVFHDHWLGLVALANGELRYLDTPLQDYVQHGGNVTQSVDLDWREARLPEGARRTLRNRIGARLASWRELYANEVLQREIFARVLELRSGSRLNRRQRRVVRLFAGADSRFSGPARVAALGLSRRRRETTGGLEGKLAGGLLWRRLASGRTSAGGGEAVDPARGGPLPVRDHQGRLLPPLRALRAQQELPAPREELPSAHPPTGRG